MEQTLIDALLTGSPWAVVAILGYFYLTLQRRLEQLAEARVKDAKKVAETMLEITRENNATTTQLVQTLKDNTHALAALRDTVRGRQ